MDIFQILIWAGTGLTALGLLALGWCIIAAWRLRRSNAEDAEMRARMRTIVAVNMGALAASALGLMSVIMGIMLGN